MIFFRLGRCAEFCFMSREAGRSTTMMASDRSTRSFRAILFLMLSVGLPGLAAAATLEDSAKEFAQKIAAALPGRENVSCEIRNFSSLKLEETARVEQTLKAELQYRGIRVSSSGSTNTVVVTLSENYKNYVWTAEIHEGDDSLLVLMAPELILENRGVSGATPVTIRSEKFWEGREQILDAGTINSSDGGQLLLLLTVDGVLFSKNRAGTFARFSFPPVTPPFRNPAGTLTEAGNEVTASMPMQICVFSLDPDGLSQCHPAPTEAPPPGRVFQNLQPLVQVPPAPPHPEWGNQIQKIQNRCGSEAQFLVTGSGDYTQTDFVQLFGSDPTVDRPAGKPLSNQLAFPGPVMDLHADGTGARAVVRNLETGSYEAHRISIECGR